MEARVCVCVCVCVCLSVIQLDSSHTPEPRHVLSRHSLPITDLHCGLMGAQARIATASLDQTVKVWELSSGELLLSILFDVEIMSVTFDPCEYFLFCGGSDGNIFQVSLCSQSLSRDKSFTSDNDGNQVFKGHRNLVTCLSVSMDGTLLLSGSHDETVRLWDIQSKQSVRCLSHKGKPPPPLQSVLYKLQTPALSVLYKLQTPALSVLYKLQTPAFNLSFINFKLQPYLSFINCKLQPYLSFINCKLQPSVCPLQTTNSSLQSVLYKLQTPAFNLSFINYKLQPSICPL
uniref:WD repeat-containing protein 18-like n=1 Tax=Labrus bergylta TaxID=56723 RepID=A0A3Q3EYH7_9LABR|nr:WD repeat-containing protein 18-like [Labrus bergylta]